MGYLKPSFSALTVALFVSRTRFMDQQSSIHTKAFFAMLLGGVMIGFSPILMRYSTVYADVSTTGAAFWRVALSLPVLVVVVLLMNFKQKTKASAETPSPFVRLSPKALFTRDYWLLGFFFAADLAFWHWSVDHTTVANAALLANMAALFTALFGYLFFKERFAKRFLIGLFLSLSGAVTLMAHSFDISPENLFGDMLALITAGCYAGYIIVANRTRKRRTTMELMFWGGLVSALLLWPFALLEDKSMIPATLAQWAPLFGLAWGAHLLGQSLIMYGLAHLTAAMGSVSLLIQPLVAALLASSLFGEQLVIFHLIGGVLIISGIYICKRNSAKVPASGASPVPVSSEDK